MGARPAGALRSAAALAISLALVFLVAAIGGWVTAGNVDGWYRTLAKPSFNPPDWIFGPVWTTLYILMAIAAWRVWRRIGTLRNGALTLYLLQLALNLAWSILFFGLHLVGWALLDLALLLAMLLATTIVFGRIDRWAGLCLLPYALWVSFAGVLNAMIWRLN